MEDYPEFTQEETYRTTDVDLAASLLTVGFCLIRYGVSVERNKKRVIFEFERIFDGISADQVALDLANNRLRLLIGSYMEKLKMVKDRVCDLLDANKKDVLDSQNAVVRYVKRNP